VDLDHALSTLRRMRLVVAVVVLLALGAAVLAGYRPVGGGFPPKLEPRITSLGVASKQVVLDGWRSPLIDKQFDTEPLTARSATFALVLSSPELIEETSRKTGIPASEITTEGPFVGPAAPWNVVVPAEARSNQVSAEHKVYRLSFVTRQTLPVLTIHAQGPSPAEAARLAEGAYEALQSYLAGLAADIDADVPRPIVLHDMGPAASGPLPGKVGKATVVLAFMGVLVLGLLAVLSLEALRLRLQAPRVATPW
jgi:hypothetical protein